MGFKSCSGPTWIYDSKLKIRLEKQNWENPLGGGKPFIFKASIYKASLVVLFLQSQRPETTTNKSPGGWRSRNHVGLKMGDTWYQDLCQFNRQITANPCVYNCEPTHGNCGRAGPGMDQNSGPTPIVSCFNSGCEMQWLLKLKFLFLPFLDDSTGFCWLNPSLLNDTIFARQIHVCWSLFAAIGGARRGADEAQKSAWEEEEKRGYPMPSHGVGSLCLFCIILSSFMTMKMDIHGYPIYSHIISTIFRQTRYLERNFGGGLQHDGSHLSWHFV